MNKRQAKTIAEIINGSYLAAADTPAEIPTLSGSEYEKVIEAQQELGLALLRKHGLTRPVSMERAVSIAYGGK